MNFRVRNTETETRLAATTRTLVDEIREETGVDTGYLVNGALTIASSKAWLSEAKQLHTVSRNHFFLSSADNSVFGCSESFTEL